MSSFGVLVFPGGLVCRLGFWVLLVWFDWVCAGLVVGLLPGVWVVGLLAFAGRFGMWAGLARAGFDSVARVRVLLAGFDGPVGVGWNTRAGRRVAVLVDPVADAGFSEGGKNE